MAARHQGDRQTLPDPPETARYTDPICHDGACRARQFTFVMDAKSVMTSPSAQYPLQRGFVEIRGLAEPFGSFYHYNAIQSWKLASDGGLHNIHA